MLKNKESDVKLVLTPSFMKALCHCIHKYIHTHTHALQKIPLNNTTLITNTLNDAFNVSYKWNHVSYTHTHHHHTTAISRTTRDHCLCTSTARFFLSLFGAVLSKCHCCFDASSWIRTATVLPIVNTDHENYPPIQVHYRQAMFHYQTTLSELLQGLYLIEY